MTRYASVTVTLCAAAVMLGCDRLFGPDEQSLVVRTDRVEYEAYESTSGTSPGRYSVRLVVRLENTGRADVILETCGASEWPVHSVEMLSGAEPRRSAFDPFRACPASTGVRIARGSVRVDTLTIAGPNAFDGVSGEPYGALAGRMRLLYFHQACTRGRACEDSRHVTSNSFVVSLPDGS